MCGAWCAYDARDALRQCVSYRQLQGRMTSVGDRPTSIDGQEFKIELCRCVN